MELQFAGKKLLHKEKGLLARGRNVEEKCKLGVKGRPLL